MKISKPVFTVDDIMKAFLKVSTKHKDNIDKILVLMEVENAIYKTLVKPRKTLKSKQKT